jgi:hypothetical protein
MPPLKFNRKNCHYKVFKFGYTNLKFLKLIRIITNGIKGISEG